MHLLSKKLTCKKRKTISPISMPLFHRLFRARKIDRNCRWRKANVSLVLEQLHILNGDGLEPGVTHELYPLTDGQPMRGIGIITYLRFDEGKDFIAVFTDEQRIISPQHYSCLQQSFMGAVLLYAPFADFQAIGRSNPMPNCGY